MKKLLFVCLLLFLPVLYVQQALALKQQHKEYAETKLSECNDCHKAEGIAPNHDSDWVRGHRLLAAKKGNNCSQCHKQSDCLDCHQGGGINADLTSETFKRDYVPKSHRSDFVSIHPLKARDNPQTCNRCHDQKYCTSCHDRFPKGSLRIKSHLRSGNSQTWTWKSEHSTEARRNLQSCQTCHPQGDVCIQCHSSGRVNPHPRNWKDVRGNYKDRAGSRVCLKCHLPGTF